MKIVNIFLIALIIIVNTLPASAKKWRVNNALPAPAQVDFNELTDAVDGANAGDTIYVEGSSQEYAGPVDIHKELTIIGPGYLLDQGNLQPTSCNKLPAVIGAPGIFLGFGSDGTYITGLTIYLNQSTYSINIEKTSNITITRNHTSGIRFVQGANASNLNECNNITITRNLICNDISFSSNSITNTILIANNLILDGIRVNISNPLSLISNGTIIYNTVDNQSPIMVTGSVIAYNYAGNIYCDTDNVSIHHNWLDDDTSNNQCIVDQDPTNVIDSYNDNTFSCNTDNWELEVSDQSDFHGAYNGFDPYYSADNPVSIANLPAWPVIYGCTVQPCGDTAIQVSFEVRTNQ